MFILRRSQFRTYPEIVITAKMLARGKGNNCLPFPSDMPSPSKETQPREKNLLPNDFLLPGLKGFFQYTVFG
jgi:hypothetical protein